MSFFSSPSSPISSKVSQSSKAVLITGCSTGLGLCLAERVIESGACVYGISRTNRNWKSIPRELKASRRFFLFQGDIRSEPTARRLIQSVLRKAGTIDILINNAGYSNQPTRLEELSLKEFEKNISVNLGSVFLMCKYTIPIFRKQRQGLIINVSSMAGKRAVPSLSAYSASKFGVVALSQSIAKENLDSGLKCITVCPGGMNTAMRIKLFGRKDASRQQAPEFVADVIMKVIQGKIQVDSGGDIVIRRGKVTAVNPVPPP